MRLDERHTALAGGAAIAAAATGHTRSMAAAAATRARGRIASSDTAVAVGERETSDDKKARWRFFE